MVRKTYGIYGLLEWHGYIDAGGAKMRVDFTNGSVTAHGVAPATFTTSSALTQHIIENSEQFKGGRIFIASAVELPGRKKAESTTDESAGETPNGERAAVEVTSLAEAKDYLMENHGIAASKLRSRAAILEQAAACGVEFTGI